MSIMPPDPGAKPDTTAPSEEDETVALEVVYSWLGGDRAARTLLLAPEYVSLRANIAQALAEQRVTNG